MSVSIMKKVWRNPITLTPLPGFRIKGSVVLMPILIVAANIVNSATVVS